VIVPVVIEWDAVDDADRYAVYVQPEGGPVVEAETTKPRITIQVPTNTPTLVYVTSRQGQLESISSEEMRVYVTRW
jgi:hypothetical protein